MASMNMVKDGWADVDGQPYQPIDRASAEMVAAATARSRRREAAAHAQQTAQQRAEADAWAAELDAQLGTADDAPALAAARQTLAGAEAFLAEVNAVLVEQRRELGRLENATSARLEGATVDELVKYAKGRTVTTAELDACRAVVAELERRAVVAGEERDAAARQVGRLATLRLHEHLNALTMQIAAVWSAEVWPLFEELCKVQDLIVQRGGGNTGRVSHEGFKRLNYQLTEVIDKEAMTWPGVTA